MKQKTENPVLIAPVEIVANIHFVNDEGNIAIAECRLPPKTSITEDDILEILKITSKELGTEYKPMPAKDFFNQVIVINQFGQEGNFSLPSEFDYDDLLAKKNL